MTEMEVKHRTVKTPAFKEDLFQNEINLLDSSGKIHVRNLPYYFETFSQQRPMVLNTSSDQLVSGYQDGSRPSRLAGPSGLHMKALKARSAGTSRRSGESYYSQLDSGVSERNKRNKDTIPVTSRSECTASTPQKQSSYDTFLNYLVWKMGHRPELQKNARQLIVLKSEPDLPDFVYPKDLHPKIFWRDVRQPLDRMSRKSLRSDYGQRNFLRSQNSKRTVVPSSPAATLATDKNMDFETNQILKEHSGTGTSENKEQKRKSRHSGGRKKKSRKTSKRKKNSKHGKHKENDFHDCKVLDTDSESSSEDDGNTSDASVESCGKNMNKNRRPKKERKVIPGQRQARDEEMEEGHQMEKEEKENGKNEEDGNKMEKTSSFEFGKEIPALPGYKLESRMPQRLSTRKRSALSPLKRNKTESEKITEPERRMFSSSKFMRTERKNDKENMQSWLKEQLDFSLKPCRFELPVDSRQLEASSPEEYLRTYCIVTSQFHSLYKTVFKKYQIPATLMIEYKNLEVALRDVAVNSFSVEKLKIIGSLVNLNETSTIDYKLFAGMAALAERLTDSSIKSLKQSELFQDGNVKKEGIEVADFSALDWKFKDIDINKNMKQLLRIIAL
ncbi:uncharacterized protein LOC128249593 [Octopus bimaculoides]|uniref:uncharacterized protein LOC128249593 n=1 Tax=Octopus bimaculoides TaxID=37653 RepID=UPI0022E2A006|nr:uncharacterized protein LOC128249593 [Octopus bimaculoides]